MIILTADQLRRAADIREQIERLRGQLDAILGGGASSPAAVGTPTTRGRRKRRKMSPQGLANLRAAQQARRARERAEAVPQTAAASPRRKRRLSAQGLANIRAGVAKREARKDGLTATPEAATEKPRTKAQVNEARLRALGKAREARWAKYRAAKKAKA